MGVEPFLFERLPRCPSWHCSTRCFSSRCCRSCHRPPGRKLGRTPLGLLNPKSKGSVGTSSTCQTGVVLSQEIQEGGLVQDAARGEVVEVGWRGQGLHKFQLVCGGRAVACVRAMCKPNVRQRGTPDGRCLRKNKDAASPPARTDWEEG